MVCRFLATEGGKRAFIHNLTETCIFSDKLCFDKWGCGLGGGGAVFYSIIEYYVEILAFGFCMYAGEIFGKIEQFL